MIHGVKLYEAEHVCRTSIQFNHDPEEEVCTYGYV